MKSSCIRVMIAEDSASVLLALKKLFRSTQDIVVVGDSESGANIVDQAARLKPDVVLMDVALSGPTNGIAATKAIKELDHNIRVVILTSNEGDKTLFEAFSAGADAYYLKGDFNDELLAAIRSVSKGASWLHPAIAGRVLQSCVKGAEKLSGAYRRPLARTDETLEDVLRISRELEAQGREKEMKSLLKAATTLAEKTDGNNYQQYASMFSTEADFYFSKQKYSLAESLYLKALDILHKSLGDDHVDLIKSLEKLGNLYDSTSSYAEAEQYYFRSLKIREKTGGSEDPAMCIKLAWVYRAQGKIDLALSMEEKARNCMTGAGARLTD